MWVTDMYVCRYFNKIGGLALPLLLVGEYAEVIFHFFITFFVFNLEKKQNCIL